MNKRGQVTLFVIIGIILIILILLLFFLRDRISLGSATQDNLENQFPQIREHIEECLVETATPRIYQIALQGGYLDTPDGTYQSYNNNPVSILCYNIQDKPYCRSRILRVVDMEQELSEFIQQDLQSRCLNLKSFERGGINLIQGQLQITTTIAEDTTLVEAKLPITLRRGDLSAEESEFSALLELPLGRLHQASRDIVGAESTAGLFDTVPYSITKTQLTSKPYIIQKLQPYPDKFYILKIKDTPSDELIFQFFIEGEQR